MGTPDSYAAPRSERYVVPSSFSRSRTYLPSRQCSSAVDMRFWNSCDFSTSEMKSSVLNSTSASKTMS